MTYTPDDLIRTGHRGAGAGRCATCGAKVVHYVAAQQSSGIETPQVHHRRKTMWTRMSIERSNERNCFDVYEEDQLLASYDTIALALAFQEGYMRGAGGARPQATVRATLETKPQLTAAEIERIDQQLRESGRYCE